MIMTILLIGATLLGPFLAAAHYHRLTMGARRAIFVSTSILLVASIGIVMHAALVRGHSLAVIAMIGMEFVATGALMCLDKLPAEAGGASTSHHAPVSLPLRALLVLVLSAGAGVLGLYHAGDLESLDPPTSELLEVMTPRQFDPPFLLREPRIRSCVVGAACPTFNRDRLVDCYAAHEWQLLSRVEPGDACPDGRDLSANVAVVVVAHDRPYDRWCLARSATPEPLTSPVCAARLPCTD